MSGGGVSAALERVGRDVVRLTTLQLRLFVWRALVAARSLLKPAALGAIGVLLLALALLLLVGAAAAGLASILPTWLALLILGASLAVAGAMLLRRAVRGLHRAMGRSLMGLDPEEKEGT
jgi:hypothetical protein